MVLGTSDYNKITTLLQDKAYAKLKKDPNEYIERTVLQKKSSFPEEVCASKYDHRVPGHLGFMGCRGSTNLVCR
jgi:hypothetical protein